jgi:hypothetical protein
LRDSKNLTVLGIKTEPSLDKGLIKAEICSNKLVMKTEFGVEEVEASV